ncbi:MAG: hypothetical protein GY913_06690 [Proteobacteria bacterium]|nr:hypothetical protein [Pseudomonadota bacterium]MCP4916593.1 hypothetical protein [Pseudomonadota bacterium]
MRRGSPIELIYRAHRAGEGGLLTIERPSGAVRMWFRRGKVHYAEGIPLRRLAQLMPNADSATHDILQDLGVAIASGIRVEDALEAVAEDVAEQLGEMALAPQQTASLEPGIEPPSGAFPLPRSALQLLAKGLRTARHPDAVAEALRAEWNTPLRVHVPDPSWLSGLDPVCLRTIRTGRDCATLGALVLKGGRGQVERTRHAWRAIDLLLQLRLLRPGEEKEVDWSEDVTGPLPDLDGIWKPQHSPEGLGGPVPAAADLLGAESKDAPDEVLVEEDWDDLESEPTEEMSDTLSLEAEMHRLGALCVEINPLVILELTPEQAHAPQSSRKLQEAYIEAVRRFASDAFRDASPAVQGSARSFRALLKENRAALENRAILSAWLRDLRAFDRIGVAVTLNNEKSAEAHFVGARKAAADRDWPEALKRVERAIDDNPLSGRYRILHLFLLVATRKLSALDGVLNLDALDLEDPGEMAQAQVTAGRLLKAARRQAEAILRFRTALRLDPSRVDARREIEAFDARANG